MHSIVDIKFDRTNFIRCNGLLPVKKNSEEEGEKVACFQAWSGFDITMDSTDLLDIHFTLKFLFVAT